MSHRLFHALFVAGSLALLVACEKAPEPPADGLLQHVPADTPYAFVTSKLLPEDLRDRLGVEDKGIIARRIMAALDEGLAQLALDVDSPRLWEWIQGLVAHWEHERRLYVVTITPELEDAMYERWPRILSSSARF